MNGSAAGSCDVRSFFATSPQWWTQVGERYRGVFVLGGDVVGSDEINMTDRKITFDVMRALGLPCYISPVGDDGSYV